MNSLENIQDIFVALENSEVADNNTDILTLIEQTEPAEALFTEATESTSENIAITADAESVDILSIMEAEAPAAPKSHFFTRFIHSLLGKIRFIFYYMAISSFVFVMLLAVTNFSSYSTILYTYINPNALKTSSSEMFATLNSSKITVYADSEENKEDEERIKQKLEESNIAIKEALFSPKKLLKDDVKTPVDLEITPYENRILIPKIGKNIPLVDVDPRAGFDFDHMENIFMKELEKGIVRYPGTATPGQNGNSFIFGHSSNYPWIKGDYNDVFALLDHLEFGDEIIVYYNQKKFVYLIKEKKVIKPGNVKALERDNTKKELSLMTCWPVGTTLNRLIVFAELQNEDK